MGETVIVSYSLLAVALIVIGAMILHRRRLASGSVFFDFLIFSVVLFIAVVVLRILSMQWPDFLDLAIGRDHQSVISTLDVIALFFWGIGLVGWLPSIMSINDQLGRAKVLETIAQATSRQTGFAFLNALVERLAEATDAHMVFVGLLTESGDRIRTIAVYADGKHADDFEYPLKGSPCQEVLTGNPSIYSANVATRFPEDVALAKKGIEAYAGNALINSDGVPVGILVVLKKDPISDEALVRNLMRICSDRAAAEVDRQRANAGLLRSRAQLLDAQRVGRMGHWKTDAKAEMVVWSDMIFEIVGLPVTPKVRFMNLIQLLDSDDQARLLETHIAAVDSKDAFSTTVALTRPDGEKRWVHMEGKPDYSDDGTFNGYFGILQDVTEQWLAQEALDHALQDAERANQAKSEFLATMSHEFRTPLNAILGFSEMLRAQYFGTLGSDNYKDYAEAIHGSGERMLALVNDLLDITTIEAGKRTYSKTPVTLPAVLESCAQEVEQAAADKRIDLTIDAPPDLPTLFADERSITQILINLLANAVNFTEAGGSVRASATTDGSNIQITVSDTGVGIPENKITQVVEPFSQANPNPHIAEGGSGLGLYIVKSLVDAHAGQLAIESAVGKGTTVKITLPIDPPEVVELPAVAGGFGR